MRGIGQSFAPNLTTSAATLAKQIPGAREGVQAARKFAAEPDEEPLGRPVGQYGPLFLDPFAGAGEVAEGIAAKALTRMPLAKYIPGQGFVAQVGPQVPKLGVKGASRVVKGAGMAGDVAGTAAGGAVGGALANPDDPGRGAVAGMVAGPAGKVLGPAFRSPTARWAASHALPLAVAEGVTQATGLSRGVTYPNIIWYYSPVGRKLHGVGDKIMDEFGRIIGRIGPMAAGYAGSAAGQQGIDLSQAPGGIADILRQFLGMESNAAGGTQ